MKIILVMVASLNGKITKGNNPNIYSWTSLADQRFFFSLIKKQRLIVMGAKTYKAVRQQFDLATSRLRIILTANPRKYLNQAIPGKLEFSKESPRQLVNRLKKLGYRQLLLAGGGLVNFSFLKAGLVDELHLVIEPLIFGLGKTLVAEGPLAASLKLISQKRLNNQGALLLKYKVQKI